MPISDAAAKAGGMLSDLKSRLGFSQPEDRYDDYDDYEDDGYEGGFDDDGFNERDDREFGDYGANYRDDEPVGGFRSAASSYPSRYGRADSTPNLVSIDDVKARTQVPGSLMRDPLEPDEDGYRMTRRGGRNLVESSGPAESSPAYNAARDRESARDAGIRSEGLNSLFEPSAASAPRSYDSYEAYSSTSPSTYTTSRGLTVIKPVAYGDVERVARALKAGDVVVLAMRSTPDDLSKRVLDFSFGVASALDATVESPANKVFAIARGNALTDAEKRSLSSQGVL